MLGAKPGTMAPDVVGAFRFDCMAGQVKYDDPIVFPNQPGKSHLHQFFGNTLADARSTYQSLRTSGDSTCMSPVNRSAYWMPAMLDGVGNVVRPDFVSIYYKRLPASSPDCQSRGKACIALPRGLRFIFGYNMLNPSDPASGGGYFNCQGPGATPGHYPTITEAMKHCPVGAQLGAVISAPDCWDGVNLDTADHRSHMAYPGYGWWGYLKCDDQHPYVIPGFQLGAWFTVDANFKTWHLSSDEMMPGTVPGTTFHADWFGAWDDKTMATWTANCIDKLLSCSGGELGDGTQMTQAYPFSWTADPHTIPKP